MYRFDGKAKRITFGNYPKMSVAAAHAAFGKALSDLEKGIDPDATMVNLNKEDKLTPTVEALVNEYLEKWAKPRKRSWQEDERMLTKDVIPYLGKQKAKNVRRRDIVMLLDKILGSMDAFKSVKHFTPHDLRRTAASIMTSLGIPRLVVSKLLNYVENSVTATYDRHTYDNEKREAIEKWGTKLKSIV